MTLDPRAKRLLDMLALQDQASPAVSLANRRDGLAKLMELGGRATKVSRVHDLTIPGPGGNLPLRIYDDRNNEREPGPAALFLHGGGLVAGSLDTHDSLCRNLAAGTDTIIVSVGYRLAPEYRFPAALDDAACAVEWMAREGWSHGIDPERVAVTGESAGGLLASLIAGGYRQVDAKPRAMLLLCPVIDLAGTYPSRAQFGKGFLIDAETVNQDVAACLQGTMSRDEIPSPLRYGRLATTPPSIILAAGCDPFRDEATLYAEMLTAAGIPVQYTCHPGMIHSFVALNALLPQADKALREVKECLSGYLS